MLSAEVSTPITVPTPTEARRRAGFRSAEAAALHLPIEAPHLRRCERGDANFSEHVADMCQVLYTRNGFTCPAATFLPRPRLYSTSCASAVRGANVSDTLVRETAIRGGLPARAGRSLRGQIFPSQEDTSHD